MISKIVVNFVSLADVILVVCRCSGKLIDAIVRSDHHLINGKKWFKQNFCLPFLAHNSDTS